eukprot:1677413-Rhodomonas_salina.4
MLLRSAPSAYAMCGTAARYAATSAHAMSGTAYAMSGTAFAMSGTAYAMSGTKLAYGVTQHAIISDGIAEFNATGLGAKVAISLRACYAVSGTDLGVWFYQP